MRQISGLFTECNRRVEQGTTEGKSSEWQGGLEPGTLGYKSSTQTTRPRRFLLSDIFSDLCGVV